MIDDHHISLTSPTNSTVLINSPTSMISNNSSVGVPSSQSAHNLISSVNSSGINNANSNINNNQINSSNTASMINNNNNNSNGNNQSGMIVMPHSQSAHQIGLTFQQMPLNPLSHHQALQQQLQQHFANNNMGECKTF